MISTISDHKLRYRSFSSFLCSKYGEKVYKLPLNYPGTCPNRDGNIGKGGCIYCGEEAAAFELADMSVDIGFQLKQNKKYIGGKYNAAKFIAYLQNHTATYMPYEFFSSIIRQIIQNKEGIVAIYLSTRPDCIKEEHLLLLYDIRKNYGIDCVVELGLQSGNDQTLKHLNRCHTVADFITAAKLIHSYDFEVCAHLIIDLPYDDLRVIKDTARIINENSIQQVKCHSLYILENTVLGDMYQKGAFEPLSYDEYLERMVLFIRAVDKKVVFQRLTGRAPKNRTLFCNFGKSWWVIRDDINNILEKNNYFQGDFHKP